MCLFAGDVCYNFTQSGFCQRGLACRFGKQHITAGGHNLIDEVRRQELVKAGPHTINQLSMETQFVLKKRAYDFNMAESLINFNDRLKQEVSSNKTIFYNCKIMYFLEQFVDRHQSSKKDFRHHN